MWTAQHLARGSCTELTLDLRLYKPWIASWLEMLAFSSAVAGQNLIVGHSERRGRATHIITKEGVYWAAVSSVIFVL